MRGEVPRAEDGGDCPPPAFSAPRRPASWPAPNYTPAPAHLWHSALQSRMKGEAEAATRARALADERHPETRVPKTSGGVGKALATMGRLGAWNAERARCTRPRQAWAAREQRAASMLRSRACIPLREVTGNVRRLRKWS